MLAGRVPFQGDLVGRDRDAARLRSSRRRCAPSPRMCPSRSRSSWRTRCSRSPRSATAAQTSSRRRPRPRAPRPRPDRRDGRVIGGHPARADRARARGRGDAHRAASGGPRCWPATSCLPSADAAQAARAGRGCCVLPLLLAVGALDGASPSAACPATSRRGRRHGRHDDAETTDAIAVAASSTTSSRQDDYHGGQGDAGRLSSSAYHPEGAMRVRDARTPRNIVVAMRAGSGRGAAPTATPCCLKVSRGQMSIPNVSGRDPGRRAGASFGADFRVSPRRPRPATRSTGGKRHTNRSGRRHDAVPSGSPVTTPISTGPASSRCRSSWAGVESDARATLSRCRADRHASRPGSRCSDDGQ